MNVQEKENLKKWWSQCPNKTVVRIVNVMLIIITIYCIYELGYALGKVVVHMGL